MNQSSEGYYSKMKLKVNSFEILFKICEKAQYRDGFNKLKSYESSNIFNNSWKTEKYNENVEVRNLESTACFNQLMKSANINVS